MDRRGIGLVAWMAGVTSVWAVAVVMASALIWLGNLLLDAHSIYREGWPEITFIFEGETRSPDIVRVTRFRLDYYSRDKWLMETIADDPMETRWGTFSQVGNYDKLEDGVFTSYESLGRITTTEKVEEGVTRIPGGGFFPWPFVMHELTRGKPERVTVEALVCFRSICSEKVSGWRFPGGAGSFVLLDDERGIPVQFIDRPMLEVRVHDEQRPVVSIWDPFDPWPDRTSPWKLSQESLPLRQGKGF